MEFFWFSHRRLSNPLYILLGTIVILLSTIAFDYAKVRDWYVKVRESKEN